LRCSDPAKSNPSQREVQVQEKVVPSSSKCCNVEPFLQSDPVGDYEEDHSIAIVKRSSMPSPIESPDGSVDQLSFGDAGECGLQHCMDNDGDIPMKSFRPT
jgi:hypothetical protein